MKPVKFIRAHGVYNAGEVAGFDAQTCANLIMAKVAVAYVPEDQPKDAAPDVLAQLQERVAELDAREAKLAALEAAAGKAAPAPADAAKPAEPEDAGKNSAPAGGEPPKQGARA